MDTDKADQTAPGLSVIRSLHKRMGEAIEASDLDTVKMFSLAIGEVIEAMRDAQNR